MKIRGIKRCYFKVYGTVQGVGFRPFVYRLATSLNLTGWVCNSSQGLEIEVEGDHRQLHEFEHGLKNHHPPAAQINTITKTYLEPVNYDKLSIKKSTNSGPPKVQIVPDLATCGNCYQEVFDLENRRYQYAFTNCTDCGPRYSIINKLPYDRPHTSMNNFKLCKFCREEYENPLDRRFHAQPNACPQCGPTLFWYKNHKQQPITDVEGIISTLCKSLQQGKIVALKGLGGFQLLADAHKTDTIKRLRQNKNRPVKPLALLYPNITAIENDCHLCQTGRRLLESAAAPIVLLQKKSASSISHMVAPAVDRLGVMLPCTPLHSLIASKYSKPIVATSANLSGEPLYFRNADLLQNSCLLADDILLHNRPIERPVDDSVVQVINRKVQLLRPARGYAPQAFDVPGISSGILALGAQQKNTVAFTRTSGEIIVSQHLGDLESTKAIRNFHDSINDLEKLYQFSPKILAIDLHPDYYSSSYAETRPENLLFIQHHHAHVASALVDNDLTDDTVFGIAWDGSGYGPDKTLWGGEFLEANLKNYQRFARFRHFPLPGAKKAIIEPRRACLGILYEIGRLENLPKNFEQFFTEKEFDLLIDLLKSGYNSPISSSAGRLFDAVAALIGLTGQNNYPGEAPVLLENLAEKSSTGELLPYCLIENHSAEETKYIFDWEPLIISIIEQLQSRVEPSIIARKFHNSLAEMIGDLATLQNQQIVALTGGCFQNRLLTELTQNSLIKRGFKPIMHSKIPANDGGISVGQAAIAGANIVD